MQFTLFFVLRSSLTEPHLRVGRYQRICHSNWLISSSTLTDPTLVKQTLSRCAGEENAPSPR
jgi:hypothetical protein